MFSVGEVPLQDPDASLSRAEDEEGPHPLMDGGTGARSCSYEASGNVGSLELLHDVGGDAPAGVDLDAVAGSPGANSLRV
jgi:hypothetical protein